MNLFNFQSLIARLTMSDLCFTCKSKRCFLFTQLYNTCIKKSNSFGEKNLKNIFDETI